MEKIKNLQNKIVQWAEMQNELLDRYMQGEISREEYKGTYNNLDKDINKFKKEIHELIVKEDKKMEMEMEKELNIKKMIFAEFIRLGLIEEAIKYAKDAALTDEEQQEALEK